MEIFFKNNDLKRVAIYGYGKIGKMLHYELSRTEGVDVVAVIDKNHSNLSASVPIIGPDDMVPQNDIVLVTVSDYYSVKKLLQEKCKKIISFKEFLEGYAFEIVGT